MCLPRSQGWTATLALTGKGGVGLRGESREGLGAGGSGVSVVES